MALPDCRNPLLASTRYASSVFPSDFLWFAWAGSHVAFLQEQLCRLVEKDTSDPGAPGLFWVSRHLHPSPGTPPRAFMSFDLNFMGDYNAAFMGPYSRPTTWTPKSTLSNGPKPF